MFYDKEGNEINIGDHIVPDEGEELIIINSGHVDEYDDDVMIGEQVENITTFSILTKENLTSQWTLKEDKQK